MKIKIKTFKTKTCCGNYTLYQLDEADDEDWSCADCFLNFLIEGNFFVENRDYKEALAILYNHWDCIADDDKPDVDKELKELGL